VGVGRVGGGQRAGDDRRAPDSPPPSDLLPKVDDCVRLKLAKGGPQKLEIAHVADEQFDVLAGDLAPRLHPVVRRRDRGERLHAQRGVVPAARQVVHDAHGVAAGGEVEGGGPAAVAVAA